MHQTVRRLLIGTFFALVAILFSFVFAGAATTSQSADVNCQACHPQFVESWQSSAHANSVSDPVFQSAWAESGNKSSCLVCHATGYDLGSGNWEAGNVSCAACHTDGLGSHPETPMAIERGADLCGTCHQDTYFEWQLSEHANTDLMCSDCHDVHETSLKKADVFSLCSSCHTEQSTNFTHSEHAIADLSCSDCHLAPHNTEPGEGRATIAHSFRVDLATCTACHASQLHSPNTAIESEPEGAPDAMAAVETLTVSTDPQPANPGGLAMVSGLIGMASGMILAPWLERWYRQINQEDE